MDEELISKQRNILMDLLGSCMDLGKTSSVDVWKLHIDAAIDRLDQAYKEEGYVRPDTSAFEKALIDSYLKAGGDPDLIVMSRTDWARNSKLAGVMTGQEWYDRFSKKLPQHQYVPIVGNLTSVGEQVRHRALGFNRALKEADTAAQKAAGIE